MNLEQVLSLLDNQSSISTSRPSTPQRLTSNSLEQDTGRTSIFGKAWNMLHHGPLSSLSRTVSNSKNNTNDEIRETGDDPNNNNKTGASSPTNSVGPPSTTESLNKMHNLLEGCLEGGTKVRTSVPRLFLNNKLSSTHSKILIRDSKTIQRKPSDGINAILDCSSTSVGSTHRSSMTFRGPKCAYDYIKMVQNAEGTKMDDIPMNHFSYEKMDQGRDLLEKVNDHNKQSSYNTPILTERKQTTRTINKSFLETVNEQIQHIKANQARDRSILYATLNNNNNNNGEAGISGDSMNQLLIQQSCDDKPQEILTTGTSKHIIIIDDNIRNKIRAESSIQTETGFNSPFAWGLRSRIDSQMTILPNRPRNLACIDWSVPLSADCSPDDSYHHQREILKRQNRGSSSFFGNFLNFNDAFGISRYSLQIAWNTADETFRSYVISQESTESHVSNEEMQAVEDVVAVSVMRLLGMPMQTRYAIYNEVLQEIQVVHDFSVGTIQLISNMIDWICTGKHEGAEDLVSKTRLLATSQTEVDPDSDSWTQFERDIGVFSEAVTKAVESAARVVSCHCTESCESLVRRIPSMIASMKNNEEDNDDADNLTNEEKSSTVILRVSTPYENFDSSNPSRPNNMSIEEEEEAPVNMDVIGQMVTDSEFELPPVTTIPRTESQSSSSCQQVLLSRKKSRIPILVVSSTISNGLQRQTSQREEEDQIEQDMSISMLREAMRNEERERGRRLFGPEVYFNDDTLEEQEEKCHHDDIYEHEGADEETNDQSCFNDDEELLTDQTYCDDLQSFNGDDMEEAWQVFDHGTNKHQEEEPQLVMSRQLDSVSQSSVQNASGPMYTPPESAVESNNEEESMTARMSKAALRGLYNVLKDAIPSPLITVSYNDYPDEKPQEPEQQPFFSSTSSLPNDNNNVDWSEENLSSQAENNEFLDFAPDVTQSRILETPSGHRYLINSRRSSIHKNINTASSKSSVRQIRVPTNSDAEFNRQLADARTSDDITYLEQVLKTLKESSNPTHDQPNSNSSHPTSTPKLMSGQQQQQSRKIPVQKNATTTRPRGGLQRMKQLSSGGKTSAGTISRTTKLSQPTVHQNPAVNSLSKIRHGFDGGSASTASTPPSRPRIVRQQILNRTIPVKPKLQIINAVPSPGRNSSASGSSSPRPTAIPFHSSQSQYASRPTSNNSSTNDNNGGVTGTNNSRLANIVNNKGGGGSYVYRNEMLKKNQSIAGSGGRSRTTYYSSIPPEINNNNNHHSPRHMKSSGTNRPTSKGGSKIVDRPMSASQRPAKAKVTAYKYDDGTHDQVNPGSSQCSSTCSSRPTSHNPVTVTNYASDSNTPSTKRQNSGVRNNPPLFFPSLDSSRPFVNPFAR